MQTKKQIEVWESIIDEIRKELKKQNA